MSTTTSTDAAMDVTSTDEYESLAQKPAINASQRMRCGCNLGVKYHLPMISEKGACVTLVWNVLMCSALYAQLTQCYYMYQSVIAFAGMSLSFPIAGFLADVWVGRYKVLRAAMCLLLVSALLNSVLHFVQLFSSSDILMDLTLFPTCLGFIGIGCHAACIIPFTTDQLIGASAEQLGFAVYWLIWGFGVGMVMSTMLDFFLPKNLIYLAPNLASLTLLVVAVIVFWCWNDSLMKVPQISNPIKHIFRVLNYARKHKFPEQRSALTYWEEDYPSRLDLGKSRYGGPFTVEEVEDVKTVLRLIPLILCGSMYRFGDWIEVYWFNTAEQMDLSPMNGKVLEHMYKFGPIIGIVALPVYHFLIYPVFYNRIPGILKKVGTGLSLTAFSHLVSAVAGALQICAADLSNATCNGAQSLLPVFDPKSGGMLWMIIPSALYNIGYLLAAGSLIEFIIAQTPHQIKGLMSGFAIMACILFTSIGQGLFQAVVTLSSNSTLDTWFHGNVAVSVIIFLGLLVFALVSKWYKLRKRDDIVPFHMLAEQYFEKDHLLYKNYLRQYMSTQNTISINMDDTTNSSHYSTDKK